MQNINAESAEAAEKTGDQGFRGLGRSTSRAVRECVVEAQWRDLTALGPSQAVGALARGDARCDFEFVQVDYGDGVVAGQSDVGARSVGTIRMPPGPRPTLSILMIVRVAVSTITSSPVPGSEIRASFPSCVNFRRLECLVRASKVWITLLVAVSMTETVPSPELAAQTSLSSGERSIPSGPLPTGDVGFLPAGRVGTFFDGGDGAGVHVGGEESH